MALVNSWVASTEAAMLNLSYARINDLCRRTDTDETFVLIQHPSSLLSNWQLLTGDLESSDYISVTDYGASGSGIQVFASTTEGSAEILLSQLGDFQNGQVVQVEGVGPICELSAPSGLTVTPENSGGGSTSYEYAITAIDSNMGSSPASSSVSISTGAATLGLNGTSQAFNRLTWDTVSNAVMYCIYKLVSGTLTLIGATTELQYDDIGVTYTGLPNVPSTAPNSATNGDLITTILSGQGTVNLVLAAAASKQDGTAYVNHNDTAAITAAIAEIANLVDESGTIYFPPGNYRVWPPIQIGSYTTLLGNGAEIATPYGGTPCITTLGAEQSALQNLSLNGAPGFMILGAGTGIGNFRIVGCTFSGIGAIGINSGALGVTIRDCYFQSSGRNVWAYDSSDTTDVNNWRIEDSWFQSPNFENYICAPFVGGGGRANWQISNCVFEGPPQNARCIPFILGGITEVIFTNCELADWSGDYSQPAIMTGWANNTGVLGLHIVACEFSAANGDLLLAFNNSNVAPVLFIGGHHGASNDIINGNCPAATFINTVCNDNAIPASVVSLLILNSYFNATSIPFYQTPTTMTDSSTGLPGQQAWDANYIYVCTNTNTWKRATLLEF